MRKSQITLLAAAAVLAVVIVTAVALVRGAMTSYAANPVAVAGDEPGNDAPPSNAAPQGGLVDFDGVEIRNQWQVRLTRGDTWEVALSVPQGREDEVDVRVEDGRLVLGTGARRGRWRWGWFGTDDEYRADVTMPALASIVVLGSADVRVAGFDGESLVVRSEGAVNLEGGDSRFDRASLTLAGANNVDLGSVPVGDVEINIAGANNVRLLMDGGRLSGELAGFGNVEYTGVVSEQSVDVNGFGRVERVDE